MWKLYPQNEALAYQLANALKISPITAQVLINRGVTNLESAESFLYPKLQQLHDPFLFADMEKGVNRVIKAIKENERITIYGDYDTDGATSTALLVKYFGSIGIKVDHYIPHRILEGYGVNKPSIETIKKRGTSLIITVDNGINAVDEIDYAKSLGMDVIVTDHHEPKEKLPNAFAVINPKRGDCRFPFKHLAGVGVAFNFVMALRQRMRDEGFFKDGEEPKLRDLLDFVAVGTVADVVPLFGENRIFVKYGLEELKKTTNKGLNALKIISGIENLQLNTTSIAYRLAPRLNAAGRVDDQYLGPRLLTIDDAEEATQIAQKLHSANTKRQGIEEKILKEIEQSFEDDPSWKETNGLVLAKKGWHPGVIGIVSTRISERYKKPTVIISISDEIGRGSARGVGEYNIIEALKQCSDLLMNYGGHNHAAGITIEASKIEEFRKRFDEVVESTLTEEETIEKVMVDVQLESENVSFELINELELLEPFGEGNAEPVFCIKELKVSDVRIVKEKHLKLSFSDDMVRLDAIGFGMGGHDVAPDDILDVAFVPQRDTWRGERTVQLRLKGIRTS